MLHKTPPFIKDLMLKARNPHAPFFITFPKLSHSMPKRYFSFYRVFWTKTWYILHHCLIDHVAKWKHFIMKKIDYFPVR